MAQVVRVALVVLVARMAAAAVVEALVALAALVAALVVRVKARSVHMPCTPHTRWDLFGAQEPVALYAYRRSCAAVGKCH